MKKFYFLVLALGFFTNVSAQIVNIPDANFKNWVTTWGSVKDLNGILIYLDANNNNEVEVTEALNVSEIILENRFIGDLTGIEYFTNVKSLKIKSNSLTSLDVSQLTQLEYLDCYMNRLTSLNVTGLNRLTFLNCSYNQLTSLNVNSLNQLQTLNCIVNNIQNLSISNLQFLTNLQCQGFGAGTNATLMLSNLPGVTQLIVNNSTIANITLTGLPNLTVLNCRYNALTQLDLSGALNLVTLYCENNSITSLDLSDLHYLDSALMRYNALESLFIKNGRQYTLDHFTYSMLSLNNNPNLRFVCADEHNINLFASRVAGYGYSNCVVNSYCSFVPGGVFYEVQGNNKFDYNANGCDSSDFNVPNFKYNITNGTVASSLISDTTGNYAIAVGAGTHVISPVIENPAHFIVSPTSVNVTFPTQTSPFTQNFCVTPNGIHPDLEIVLVPIIPARPGFDAKYKIVYKNKGNQTQSGSVNLTFDDAILDFFSANPTVNSQTTNNLSWDFVNLQPFETREIALTLNLNSPLETPAVNAGNVLNYTTTVSSATTDETPADNTFTFNQTVVNSFDPNDKTCLQGATISPSEVGKYVHYLIRFENNGTANAHNIVVKDMIDIAKFDINTLVPLKGSHSFVTNITAGNKVEFIFENINLPFDDANNDGYVAFKIKTLPTLVNGDTFSNSASIYFDYNFPIVTNTAVTTIQALSTQDFAFGTYFTVYPNPVNNVLNIETKQTIEVSSVSIYNQLGQLVLIIPNAQNTKSVDVSSLSSGNYFVKINSDKGTSNTKFIKQ